jgi:hypothetical protein
MPLLRAVTKIKRRRMLAARTSRWMVLPLRLVGVVAHVATSGHDSPLAVMRVVHGARCTTPSAIALRNARRSRSSRCSSMSNISYSHIVMAHLPSSGRVSNRLSGRTTRMRRWHSRMPKELSRPSAVTLTPTLALTSVIPRSEIYGTKPPYVCPGCSNHTHGNNMINRCNVIKITSNSLT